MASNGIPSCTCNNSGGLDGMILELTKVDLKKVLEELCQMVIPV